MTTKINRNAAVRTFVRKTFGLGGALRLHRAAFGLDLLRAPANVFLAPIFLITRLVALLAMLLRFRKVAGWLLRRKILFETSVSRQVGARVTKFIVDLDAMGLGVNAPRENIERAVDDYAGVRHAVAEMTTTLLVLIGGYMVFQAATPGVISLAGPVAEMQAQASAIEQFPLGQGLGRAYYGMFPTSLAPWQVLLTGVVLATIASVVTTFAGVIADPLQVLTGTHRRRMLRLLRRLEVEQRQSSGLSGEHVAARMADITDMAVSFWRMLRG